MTLHERLEILFQNVFDNDAIVLTDETTAEELPEWDSLAHINLMFSIEQEFGVQFVNNQLAEFANIGELKRFLMSQADSV
jgi:acyl carrier protein